MQKSILIILSIFSFFNGFSQEKEKSKFSVKVGTEYRITPIYTPDESSIVSGENSVNFNLDNQLSGTSINYILSYRIFKKFEIGFSQSFRYDHVYYKSGYSDLQPTTAESVTQSESINRWITDHHFFVGQYFALGKVDLFLKVGVSMMNKGTNYQLVLSHGIGDNVYLKESSSANFNFSAFTANIGFVSNKFELGIGAYFVGEYEKGDLITRDSNGVIGTTQVQQNVILPFLKLSYIIK